jgi:hypothetical protein
MPLGEVSAPAVMRNPLCLDQISPVAVADRRAGTFTERILDVGQLPDQP